MSDSSIHEAVASAVLRSVGKDARKIRRAIAEFERQPQGPAESYVLGKLKERLAEVTPPVERERGP